MRLWPSHPLFADYQEALERYHQMVNPQCWFDLAPSQSIMIARCLGCGHEQDQSGPTICPICLGVMWAVQPFYQDKVWRARSELAALTKLIQLPREHSF